VVPIRENPSIPLWRSSGFAKTVLDESFCGIT
jgi:hypothetical protein